MRHNRHAVFGLLLGSLAAPLWAQSETPGAPLSVIDWLDTVAVAPAVPFEPPVSSNGGVPEIETTPLDGPAQRVTGLVASSVTGLPETLWTASDGRTLAGELADLEIPTVPAIQSLLFSLLLTETLPPQFDGSFQRARIDALVRMGVLEPALSLIDVLDPKRSKEVFQRHADLSLLNGTETAACATALARPNLSPSKAFDVFCHARSGRWETAALIFGSADALGLLSPVEGDAMARFLDPDLFEGEPPLPALPKPDALMFTVYEALGQRQPTQALPLVFAHADLSERSGWKARIDAAERLAQHGAITPNSLLGVYSNRRPSASGATWDRVKAVQRFETALQTGSSAAIEKTLPTAWAAMQDAGLHAAFASLFAEPLLALDLPESLPVRDIVLLSDAYEAAEHQGDVLSAIASGETQGATAKTKLEAAVLAGLNGDIDNGDLVELAGQNELGLALIRLIALMGDGLNGDTLALSEAFGTMRAFGLEDTARRTALYVLLNEI